MARLCKRCWPLRDDEPVPEHGDFTEEIERCPPGSHGSGLCEGTHDGHWVIWYRKPDGTLVVAEAPCAGPGAEDDTVERVLRSIGVPLKP